MFKFLIDDLFQKRYDYVFFLPGKEIYDKDKDKIIEDGTRYQTTEELKILDDHMELVFTRMFNVDNVINLDCSLDERAETVMKILINNS